MAADPRYLSNRIFNDRHQNLHSARGLTQWVWLWGQFIDHTIGLRDGNGEQADLPYDTSDPLEEFVNETGTIPFQRSAFEDDEDGTHEQSNNVSSFIDAFNVYGGSEERLEWLREGPVDGDLSNNAATLLSTDDGHLPTADTRPDVEAPSMELAGRLSNAPEGAVIAGDRRANENIALTATQTCRRHRRRRLPVTAASASLCVCASARWRVDLHTTIVEVACSGARMEAVAQFWCVSTR